MSKKQSFLAGAALLGIAGILVKIIGALYRIPLTNIVGLEGIGLYQIAYPIYTTLLMVSSAGLPTAISKMVAENLTLGRAATAHRVFQISLLTLFLMGLLTSAALFFGADLIAKLLGDAMAAAALRAISPALLFVSVLSAFRGYFQGMQYMAPTAFSQIVEQLGKLIAGLYLASLWLHRGPAWAAAGAMLGVTLSEVAALALLLGVYGRKKRELLPDIRSDAHPPDPPGKLFGRLLSIAVPVTIGACITPLVGMLDSPLVYGRMGALGYEQSQIRELFGLFTGAVNTLANMPAVLTVALAMSLVPAVSAAVSARDKKAVRLTAGVGLKLSLMLGYPCMAGLWLLAPSVIGMLYRDFTPMQITIAAGMLRTMSFAVLFLFVIQTLTGILQGLGKPMLPVRNLAVGAVCKIALGYFLIAIPEIGIQGAPIGTLACYMVAAFLDLASVMRRVSVRNALDGALFKPLLCTALMILAVLGVTRTIEQAGATRTLLAVAAGGGVYALSLLLSGALGEAELLLLPGGGRAVRALRRVGLIKKEG